MSLSSQNLLDIAEAVTGSIALATNVDYAIPSPFHYKDKGDFFNSLDEQDTKTEIETTLIRACWLRYLTFGFEEEDGREIDGAVLLINYELTVFHESNFDRLDETATPDDFNKQISKTNHEHVTAVMSLVGQFLGVNSIAALAPGTFAVAETIGLAQIDNSEHNIVCDYVPNCVGDQTKLECRVRVQLPC